MTKRRRTRESVFAILTAAMLIFSVSMPVMAFEGEAAQNDTAVEETTQVEKEAPAKESAPAEKESPAKEAAPAEKEAPAQEAAPAEKEAPAKEAAPAEKEAPAQEAAPAEKEAPVEEAAPAEKEDAAEEAAPAEKEDAVEEAAPAEKEDAAEEAVPAKEEAAAEEKAPNKEAAPLTKSAPALRSASAEAADNTAEDPDDDSWGYGNNEKTVKWRLVEKDGKQTLVFEVLDSASEDKEKAITRLIYNDSHAGNKFARESLAGIVEAIHIPKEITGIGWTARYSEDGKDLYEGDYPINRDEAGVFQYFKKLSDVEIEDDNAIVRIGWSAFRQCTSLTAFDFTKLTNLEEIMNQAFSPSGIKEADLSECTNLKKIYQSAFYDSDLTTVVLPEGLEVIGYKAFANTDITEVTIPGSVTRIYDNAFNNCKQLGKLAFENASNMEYIGNRAFSGTGRNSNQLNPFTTVTDEETNTTAKTRKTARDMFSGNIAESAFDFTGLSKNENNEWSTVTFVDEDGNTILERTDYLNGETPEYSGKAPAKEATAEYSYEFDGWTPGIGAVEGSAIYTATYKAIEIIFEDDADVEDDTDVEDDVDDDDAAEIMRADSAEESRDAESEPEIAEAEAAPEVMDAEEAPEAGEAEDAAEIKVADAETSVKAAGAKASVEASGAETMVRTANAGSDAVNGSAVRVTAANDTANGSASTGKSSVTISEKEVPLAESVPHKAEGPDYMKVLPAVITALGIALIIILRKKSER